MTLRQLDEPLGPPWRRPLAGTLEELVVESEVLAGNPLGDPARRPLYVYTAPGASGQVPAIYMLQGYGNRVDHWLAPTAFEPTKLERIDAMFAAGDCPPAVVVLIDAWTRLGGSQFVNSTATGRYMDYICDEIVPFVDARYPVRADRDGRGVAGHSSGGYGALVNGMLRPDVFGAIAAHAPDALFESMYMRDFPDVVRTLRDRFDGSLERCLERAAQSDPFDWESFGAVLLTYLSAAAYSPDPADPTRPLLPFDVHTGRLVADVWERWLACDPVRMAVAHADALRSMRRIHLEAGRRDDYYLDLSTQALADELAGLGVEHTFELFDGGHTGISYRYPAAIRELVVALSG